MKMQFVDYDPLEMRALLKPRLGLVGGTWTGLANQVGVGFHAVSNWVSKRVRVQRPSAKNCDLIADAVGLPRNTVRSVAGHDLIIGGVEVSSGVSRVIFERQVRRRREEIFWLTCEIADKGGYDGAHLGNKSARG